jgi:hypothetical protein
MRRALLAILLTLATGCPGSSTSGLDAASAPDAAAVDAGPRPCTSCDAGADAGANLGDAGQPTVKIKSVLPSRGPLAGGTNVTVEGGSFYLGFASGSTDAKKSTHVHFGSNEAAEFDIIDDDTLEVVAPPNPAGAVDVIVDNPNGHAVCSGCFTYFLDLSLTSVTPDHGPLAGGIEIELKGDAFSPSLTVLVGGKASPRVNLVDSQTVRALVPPGDASGPVDVRVFNKNGIGEIRRGFTYLATPTIDRVDPPYGPIAGGGQVRVLGQGLSTASHLRFGAIEAVFFGVDDGTLTATVPPGPGAGPVDVSVETAQGNAELFSGYIYFDPTAAGLSVVSAWPTHGPAAGDSAVTVVGSGFDASTTFQVGGSSAMVLALPDPHVAVVMVQAGPANQWVAVSASAGAAQASLGHGYHYNLALGSVSPPSGASEGGDPVTLRGAGFTSGLEVFFAGLPATDVSTSSATAVAATTPVGSGAAEVRVRDAADHQNEAVLSPGFTFVEPVTVGRVSPDLGAIAGGTYVTVLGTGFATGTSVLFGTTPLKDLRVIDAHTITGHSPPGAVGAVDVAVKLGASKDVSPGAFSYFDPTVGGGGSSGGPLDGTLNVTVLDGASLRYGLGLPDATVMLGTDPSTPFQGKTDHHGQITFSDPQLVKAQIITVFKAGYQTISVAGQESQNISLFLPSNESYLGSPDQPPPDPASAGPALITGHVNGFKLPRPLTENEVAWAEVWIAPSSPYSTPPFGSQPSPDARDARGERWKLTEDGAPFTVFTSSGLRAVYAVYGIYDYQAKTFTPVLMGVHRAVNADSQHPQSNVDILLDMHLDVAVPVHVDTPAYDSLLHKMASTQIFGWLELGAEGVIPLGSVVTTVPDTLLGSMPHLDGDSLLFLARATLGDSGPTSWSFRKQLGDLSQGLTVGPMLGFPAFTTPAAGELFTGALEWTLFAAPEADIAHVRISRLSPATGWTSLWTVILPGAQRSLAMPQNLTDDMVATSVPGDQAIVSLTCARSARFDYAYWSYSSLSEDTWTSWVDASATFDLVPEQ